MHSFGTPDKLPRALKSVLAQTMFRSNLHPKVLGVVPVEDQATQEVFKKFGVEVVTVAKPDVVNQLNVAFRELDATYIQIAASDDLFYPNMFASLLRRAMRKKADITWCEYDIVEGDEWHGYSSFDLNADLRTRCFVSDQCLIRKDAWLRLGGFDESLWRYAFGTSS